MNTLDKTEKSGGLLSDKELLNFLLDHIPDSIYFKDLQSRFLKANKALAEKVQAHDAQELEGKTDFDLFTTEHARQAFVDEQRVMSTGTPIVGIEEKETWPNRPDTWVSTTKMPITNGKGDVIGTFGLSRDITEVKKYRDALQQAKEELEQRVVERTAEIAEAKSRLEQHLEQLNFLYVTSFELAQITSIDEIYRAIGKAFLSRFPFAQICICQRTKTGFACVYAGSCLDTTESRHLCEKALEPFAIKEIKVPRIVDDWSAKNHLKLSWPKELIDNPCWIAMPLIADKRVLAVIQLFAPTQEKQFYFQEHDLLATLCAHAAACLNNAFHYRDIEVRARMEGELAAARDMQQSLMPREAPRIPRVDLAGAYLPAYEVSGDYLDYFQASDGSWVLIIADVCGKGVPAALLMMALRNIARVEGKLHYSAKSLLCGINESILFNLNERSFITALCLVIKPDGSSMTYARAGHPKLLKINAAGTAVEALPCKGIAIGFAKNPEDAYTLFEEVSIPLVAGDTFVAFTDGLTDAANDKKELYGIARLAESLQKQQNKSPKELVETILENVDKFTNKQPQSDDLTMFAMKVNA